MKTYHQFCEAHLFGFGKERKHKESGMTDKEAHNFAVEHEVQFSKTGGGTHVGYSWKSKKGKDHYEEYHAPPGTDHHEKLHSHVISEIKYSNR